MNKNILKVVLTSLLLIAPDIAQAKQSTEANPWGYSGLINMPTANTLGFGEFYINGNYLARNPGFTANAYMGIFDRLELGIVGGIPSAGFSGLAGNLKYQLIKPTTKIPTALAVGLSLIGLAQNTKLTTGNSLYMVLSHDFNWQLADKSIYNLFSGHVGFSGNLDGSRIMVGLDVPITEYVNLNGEYLGKALSANQIVFDEMINFGIKVKPLPWLSVSFLTMGTSTKGFANTEYLFNLAYNGTIPFMQLAQSNQDEKNDKITIKPEPKATPSQTPEYLEPTSKPTSIPTPVSTPLPKPSAKIVLEPIPTAEPTVIPTPNTDSTPSPLPKPKVTAEAIKQENYGVLKGDINGSFSNSKPENVIVTLKSLKGNFNQKENSDSEGNYTFNNIPKGDYLVTFQKEGFNEIKRQIFINTGDTTEVNIEMTAINGSLSGRVLDNKGNALEDIALALDKGRKTLTQKNGKFNFTDVQSGYHLLSVYSAGKEVKSFDMDIIAGTELTKEIILDIAVKKTIIKANPVKQDPIIQNTPIKKEEPIIKTPEINTDVNTNIKVKDKPLKEGLAGIGGKVSDKNGALKGSRVMFEGDKLTVMTISGNDGNYLVKNIPLGTYKMTISKPGYVTRIFSVKIKDAKQARHDVKLNLE